MNDCDIIVGLGSGRRWTAVVVVVVVVVYSSPRVASTARIVSTVTTATQGATTGGWRAGKAALEEDRG